MNASLNLACPEAVVNAGYTGRMLLGILGATFIALFIYVGLQAMRDPEAGLGDNAHLPELIVPRARLLDARQAEAFRALEDPLRDMGLAIFPKVRMETVFEPGRLTHTGWHRMKNAPIDFLVVRRETFQAVGLILLESAEAAHYLEAENLQMKESAIAESGIPLLKLSLDPDKPLGETAEDMLGWVRQIVLAGYSEGSRTQVDLL